MKTQTLKTQTEEVYNLIKELESIRKERKLNQDAYNKEFNKTKKYNENFATNINNLTTQKVIKVSILKTHLANAEERLIEIDNDIEDLNSILINQSEMMKDNFNNNRLAISSKKRLCFVSIRLDTYVEELIEEKQQKKQEVLTLIKDIKEALE